MSIIKKVLKAAWLIVMAITWGVVALWAVASALTLGLPNGSD